jgi:hypothetical protein
MIEPPALLLLPTPSLSSCTPDIRVTIALPLRPTPASITCLYRRHGVSQSALFSSSSSVILSAAVLRFARSGGADCLSDMSPSTYVSQLLSRLAIGCVPQLCGEWRGYTHSLTHGHALQVFVNVCESDVVAEPTKSKEMHEGKERVKWSVPHSVTPHREDIDKGETHSVHARAARIHTHTHTYTHTHTHTRIHTRTRTRTHTHTHTRTHTHTHTHTFAGGSRCIVYDVVFHPSALRMAGHHPSFKRMIETTSLDGIEQRFPQVRQAHCMTDVWMCMYLRSTLE